MKVGGGRERGKEKKKEKEIKGIIMINRQRIFMRAHELHGSIYVAMLAAETGGAAAAARRCVTCMAWYGWWCIGVTWSHIPILSKKDVDVGVKAVHLLLYSPGPGGVGPLVAPSMTTMLDPAMIGLAASKVQA